MAAMHATDAAGRKHLNAGAMRNPHGGGNGRGAIPFPGNGDGQVPRAYFFDIVAGRNLLELILVEADTEIAIKDRNRGGYRTATAHDLFEALRSFHILRPRAGRGR